MSVTSHAPHIPQLAIADLTVAAALLRSRRSGVVGLDLRHLTGGAQCLAIGPRAWDTYCAAIDAGLSRMRGLTNRGFVLVKGQV